MSVNHTILFFRSLHESGLAPGTITTAKSGLNLVFYYGFKMDLNDRIFASIPKACAKLRPAEAPYMLSWSLNKVLKLASETENDSCPIQLLLRKTLFLVALASGARVSELDALSRDKGFVQFEHTGSVKLSPHKLFLAKNEDPQNRWKPWDIVSLPQDLSLCPVAALKAYINRTSQWNSGRLFRRERGGTLSIDGIRQQILYFIKLADPDSILRAHDVRKVATSINYFYHMDFDALTKYTGWRSKKVFLRHYFKQLEDLKFHTVAAGKVIPPVDCD